MTTNRYESKEANLTILASMTMLFMISMWMLVIAVRFHLPKRTARVIISDKGLLAGLRRIRTKPNRAAQ